MKLLTAVEIDRLTKNGEASRDSVEGIDHAPVAKLFTPDAGCTWLLSEIDPDNADIAFGLCDLGFDCPELGSVSLSEIASVRGKLGLPVERDLSFVAEYPLSVYAEAAREAGGFIESREALDEAAEAIKARDGGG